jgi:hypothetical protein
LPVKLISALKGASPKNLCGVEVLGRGGGLHWECLDLDLSVPGLLSSLFSGLEWLAELGRIGLGIPPLPKQLQHAGTGARAAARAFDKGSPIEPKDLPAVRGCQIFL